MSDHIKQIASVLVSRGFTPVAAAGIIGNAYAESGLNPSSMEPASAGDGSHNGGLWGFTAAPHSLADVQSFASAHGLNWQNPKTQALFLVNNIDPATKQTLNSIKSPTVAASYFMNTWEKPYVPTEHEATRQQWAETAYKQITGADLGNGAVKQVAQQRAMGQPNTKTTSQTVTEPGVTTKTTTGGGVDYVAALKAALLTPTAINVNGTLPAPSLLSKFQANVGSGAYMTPVVNNVSTSAGQSATITNKTIAQAKAKGQPGQQAITGKAVADAASAGANADAQKLLHMINNVNGAAYNQGNHDDISERDVNIKAQGTDCSGFVSWLMGPHGLGIWSTSLATPSINDAPGIQRGAGKEITIWNNDNPGNSGHVFIQIGTGKHAQYWASEGGVGIHQLPLSEVQNYIQNGSDGGHYVALHPKGL